MHSIREQVEKNGYGIIENFISDEVILDLKKAGGILCENALKEEKTSVFGPPFPKKGFDQYFKESADKVGYFFESTAFDEDGKFLVDPLIALNKVGHALHRHIPAFRKATIAQNVIDVCKKLDLKCPAIVQSMYIYKHPRIGGVVTPHLDTSYLYTEPTTLYGFWFALDDATVENGCLWFVPGSHKDVKNQSRLIRNPEENVEKLFIKTGSDKVYDESDFIATPVTKGTCVIIHGNVTHRSAVNHSDKSRHAYTFHVYDSATSEYSKENWLQAEFEKLY